ncbi:MAG: aldehyde-activating protein, partial [Caulobacter sp.]|nr:aldehyde-activating protein [Caulobacter sp.]
MTKHAGGCQCGRVRYEVEVALDDTITCNCSRCGKLGSVLTFAPAEAFTLLSGEDALSEYR